MKPSTNRDGSQKNKAKKMSKAQMQFALVKKKQCDAKALAIVERLLEPEVSTDWLLEILEHISRSHMEDVAEERALLKRCGYPLCDKPLTMVITQRYHISTRSNKVYDVSRRKNFCSTRCYSAANYLLEQMLTSPLWSRDHQEQNKPQFQLLPLTGRLQSSAPGVEIDLGICRLGKETDKISSDEKTAEPLNASTGTTGIDILKDLAESIEKRAAQELPLPSEDTGTTNSDKNSEFSAQTVDETFESRSIDIRIDQDKQVAKGSNQQSQELLLSSDGTGDKTAEISGKTVDKKLASTDIDMTMNQEEAGAREIEQKFKESLSSISEIDVTNVAVKNNIEEKDSEANLIGENCSSGIPGNDVIRNVEENATQECKVQRKKRERIKRSRVSLQDNDVAKRLVERVESSLKEWVTVDTMVLLLGEEAVKRQRFESLEKQDRYNELCRKLSRVQLEDEDSEEETEKVELKPLPDYSVLKEEGQKIELKVRAYFEGRTAIELPGGETGTSSVPADPEEPDNMLPMLDARAPRLIRRRIVLERLDRVMRDLLQALAGSEFSTSNYREGGKNAALKVLVNTFSFSATNIVFKPAEWNLIALVVIKMLSMMEPRLRFLLSTRQALTYTGMILMSYKLESEYLDRLVASLIDPAQLPDLETEEASAI